MKLLSSKNLRRLLLVPVATPLLLLVLQAGYFAWMLTGGKDLESADLIVAFEGAEDRARAAYGLVDRHYAPNLLISPATERTLKLYEKRFLPSQPYARIMEDKSRTTLENAVHTREILSEKGFRSAILVTSWYHVPRSYFLLMAAGPGSGIRVQPHPVASGKLDRTNWYRSRLGWMIVYNEMVKFWGSLIELATYKITGELSDQALGKSTLAARLKEALLFRIDLDSLHR
jgi:uncharacterized SAM-binding protein YcdF (DUF218 family)